MKNLIAILTMAFALLLTTSNVVYAQDAEEAETTEEVTEAPAKEETPAPPAPVAEEEAPSGFRVLVQNFIDGGVEFMGIVLVCLILGLAICIERVITLSLVSTNVDQLLADVEGQLQSGNVEGAKEICKSNRSPIASIMYQGLERSNDGLDVVEKSVVAYGSVQMGILEKGLIWIALFIGLAPMLGFMGTVIGMIGAFDAIAKAGDISPNIVAGGIKVALLTTVFGLIVAVILQIFYNYIVSRIDGIVNQMEDASITFVDLLTKYNIVK